MAIFYWMGTVFDILGRAKEETVDDDWRIDYLDSIADKANLFCLYSGTLLASSFHADSMLGLVVFIAMFCFSTLELAAWNADKVRIPRCI